MRRPLEIAWKAAAIAALAWLVNTVLNGLLFAGTSFGDGPAASPGSVLALSFVRSLLLTVCLLYPTLRSALAGTRLAVALFLAAFGIGVALSTVEGLVFLENVPAGLLLRSALSDTVTAALLALLLARALGGRARAEASATAPGSPRGAWGWGWRMALCSFGYVILYFTAGALIWPRIRWFYEAEGSVPDPLPLLLLQIVRGALYVLFVLPLLRSLLTRRWQASLAMAVMFPVLAGVAGLLIPNPVFPDSVRLYHLIEIGWSNSVFGAVVGWLFWNPAAGLREADASPG